MKRYYINSQGGLGCNIALSSFISYIKEFGDDNGDKDYEFYVLSGYYDIFECCPYVDGVYKPNEVRDLIFDAKNDEGAKLIVQRLYDTESSIYKRVNYSQLWAEILGIPFTDTEGGTKVRSNLDKVDTMYPQSLQIGEVIYDMLNKKGFKNFIISQFTGGQSPLVQVPLTDGQPDWSKVPYDYTNEPLKRHYPKEKFEQFAELMKEAHPETAIIMYQLPNEPRIERDNVIYLPPMPYLAYYKAVQLKDCLGVVCIDSSLQHLVAGHTRTLVIWAHSLPEHFGYSYNNNVIQECRRDEILYFSALGPSGTRVRYIEPKELLKEVEGLYDPPQKDERWEAFDKQCRAFAESLREKEEKQ